ncbi:MAG: sensor histidine kinase [Demequina sp.]|uniref:sensor histidine kinase n=1 Tax=Demequina sp. TaxID=2050685 RepID=UPI0019CF19DB|nr:histidine kinase [Demequina sp.]MBC7298623.1 sensor histidine kinase [Demequina sp.]
MTARWKRGGDAGIAAAFALLALLSAHAVANNVELEYREFDTWGYILVVAQALPLAWRSVAPRTVLWIVTAVFFVTAGVGYPADASFFPLIVALYTVGASLPRHQAFVHGGAAGGVILTWTWVGAVATDYVPWTAPMTVALGVILPILFGLTERRRRERLTAFELSAERRQQAARTAAADAVRAERARIARELHDVVAHEMTVMTLQAEGARRRIAKTDPDVADALATIADSGRKGLAEMQRMIGVLRTSQRELEDEAAELTGRTREPALVGTTDQDDLAPMPSLAAIPALVKQVEDSGLPVRLTITGTSHVPAGVELSAYRIIQESLTNALKYAGPGATATVTVRRRRDAVAVTVEDDGRGVISDAVLSPGGNGLAGMKERVAALGGHIELGVRRGGGYRVHAWLPVSDDQVGAQRAKREEEGP